MRFWVMFVTLYASAHLLIWWQARRQLGLRGWSAALGLAGALVMSLGAFWVHTLPETWPPSVTIPLWWAVFGWFALVFFLFGGQAAALLLELAVPRSSRAAAFLRGPGCFFTALGLALATLLYGSHEASQVEVLTRQITSAKVSRPLRVVCVSDIHLGALNLNGHLRDLASRINGLKPDVVAFAGDIINDHARWLDTEVGVLAGITAPLKVGIFGNHERYVGDAVSADIFARSGITLLRDESLHVPGMNLRVLGSEDPGRHGRLAEAMDASIRAAAADLKPEEFSLLLLHRPVGWRETAVPLGVDLTVSGHTHGGQFFPITLVVQAIYEYSQGFFEVDGRHLGVSKGAGYWGPPVRVLAPPDILVVDVRPGREKSAP